MGKYIFFVIILLSLNSCSNYRLTEYMDRSLGYASYKSSLEIESRPSSSPCVEKWKDKKINKDYYLPNGNLVHVYPVACGCIVHKEFDKKSNLLVGYKFEGERCSRL